MRWLATVGPSNRFDTLRPAAIPADLSRVSPRHHPVHDLYLALVKGTYFFRKHSKLFFIIFVMSYLQANGFSEATPLWADTEAKANETTREEKKVQIAGKSYIINYRHVQ